MKAVWHSKCRIQLIQGQGMLDLTTRTAGWQMTVVTKQCGGGWYGEQWCCASRPLARGMCTIVHVSVKELVPVALRRLMLASDSLAPSTCYQT